MLCRFGLSQTVDCADPWNFFSTMSISSCSHSAYLLPSLLLIPFPLSLHIKAHMLGLKSTESWSAAANGCAPVTGV